MRARDVSWYSLSPQSQERIDEILCAPQLLGAVVLVRQEGRLEPPPSLYEVQSLLLERRGELERRGARRALARSIDDCATDRDSRHDPRTDRCRRTDGHRNRSYRRVRARSSA